MRTEKNASYFNQEIAQAIIEQIRSARYSIRAAVAWITDQQLVAALCAKAAEGVAVEVILANDREKNQYAAASLKSLMQQGAEVHIVGTDYEGGRLMHHKFCVIDRCKVLTGSYNWTNGARSSFMENLVVINDADTAIAYEQEFLRIKKGATESYAATDRPFAWLYSATPQVGQGQEVKVEWLAKNADQVRLNGKAVNPEDSCTFTAEYRREFVLEAVGNGYTVRKTLSVELLPPPSVSFQIDKQAILQGEIVRLKWETAGAEKVWLTGELGQVIALNSCGEMELSPVHETQFTLTAVNKGGQTQSSRMVQVFKRVEISHIQVPMPQVHIRADVGYDVIPLPSRFSLGAKELAHMWRVPSIRRISAMLKSLTK